MFKGPVVAKGARFLVAGSTCSRFCSPAAFLVHTRHMYCKSRWLMVLVCLGATLLWVFCAFVNRLGQTLKIRIDYKWGFYLMLGVFEFDKCVLFLRHARLACGDFRTPHR